MSPSRPAKGPSKIDVIVVALADAGGATAVLDTEDVAVAAYGLAPTTFCWRKYPQHIDLDMVRTTLRHAAERHDPRVTGSVRSGWNLTAEGATWVRANGPLLRRVVGSHAPANAQGVRRENLAERRELERLRTSPAFARHAAGTPVTTADASWTFRIDLYTPLRERSIKVERVRAAVSDDPQVAAFVEAAAALVPQIQAPTIPTAKDAR